MSKTLPVSDMTAHLGFWMRMVSNHVSHAFAAKLADKNVTVAEWCVMRTLFNKPPTSPSQIAEEMGMTRGAITKLADRLITKSLIVRKASEHDGRAQTLALSTIGTHLVPQLATLADQNDQQFFACLTTDECDELRRLLMQIAERNQIVAMPTD